MSIIELEKRGSIMLMTLNRPDMMNALGQEGDGPAIAAACNEVAADPEIRCAILTGAGRAFSAGGDVKAMRDKTGAFGGSPHTIRDGYRRNIHMIVKSVYNLEVPLISAINGPAIGLGCDVACMADIRIASDKAKLGVTFLKLGLIPGDGGAWLLPRLIGASRAAELLFTGDVIDAATAAECVALVQAAEPTANGATYSLTGGTACYAEFGMTGPNSSTAWQVCMFPASLLGCVFGIGDGTGGSEQYVGAFDTPGECAAAVQDPNGDFSAANGATFSATGGTGCPRTGTLDVTGFTCLGFERVTTLVGTPTCEFSGGANGSYAAQCDVHSDMAAAFCLKAHATNPAGLESAPTYTCMTVDPSPPTWPDEPPTLSALKEELGTLENDKFTGSLYCPLLQAAVQAELPGFPDFACAPIKSDAVVETES